MILYRYQVIALLLIFPINLLCRVTSDSSPSVDFHWEDVPDNEIKNELRGLQKYQNDLTAILHFIEWTHNDSNKVASRCVKKSLSSLQYHFKPGAYNSFAKETTIAMKTANLLINLLTHGEAKSRQFETLYLHREFFRSLVKANVQSDSRIFASGITFLQDPFNKTFGFSPFAYRNKSFASEILVRDLQLDFEGDRSQYREASVNNHLPVSVNGDWFWRNATTNYSDLLNRWRSRSHIAVDANDGAWTSPYFDCQVTQLWLITYLVPFYGNISNNQLTNGIRFMGIAFISINLHQTDINQCAHDDSFFADTHKCHLGSTQCHPIKGMGFRRGAYICQCKKGFYKPPGFGDKKLNFFKGTAVEEAFIKTLVGSEDKNSLFYPQHFLCLPCQSGCKTCTDDTPCFVPFDKVLRSTILTVQCICASVTLVMAIIICKLRRSKIIAASRWIMLEMVLLGALLLYITVIIRYFEASLITCFVEPWLREVGFAFCYGAIVIKVYRIFAEFQTRKAHRVCVRDKDLLKYLTGIVLVVVGYMAAWTALVFDGIDSLDKIKWFESSDASINRTDTPSNILEVKYIRSGLQYISCRQLSWDYVTEIGELLFLLTGVYITYCIRNAKKEIYREKWHLATAIYLETLVSVITYIVKHSFWYHPDLHPDHIFLLYTIRCHLTVSVTLIILFLPKIWFHNQMQKTGQHRSRHLSSFDVQDHLPGAMRMQTAILSNGEVDISDINITDMDPEDIRSELRRVYTQLQVLKNKTMRKDNPHISKRRGGRKTHRRFSLQPFHHKHKHEHEITEISRTPEESTASMEGTSQVQADGPSNVRIDSEGTNSARSHK